MYIKGAFNHPSIHYFILTPLNIFNGLVHIAIWTKPLTNFRGKLKIYTECIATTADHNQTAQMCQLILVCTGCMVTFAATRLRLKYCNK
jgi:hypothetical protein